MSSDLRAYSSLELLTQYSRVMEALKSRKIIRTNNNPVGDYSESLAAGALGLTLEKGSQKSFDAIDNHGIKFQIKGRRLIRPNDSKQLSIVRNLFDDGFDFLIGILFDWDFTVLEAYKIPLQTIKDHAWPNKHQNGHTVWLKDPLISQDGVQDIQKVIRKFSLTI